MLTKEHTRISVSLYIIISTDVNKRHFCYSKLFRNVANSYIFLIRLNNGHFKSLFRNIRQPSIFNIYYI